MSNALAPYPTVSSTCTDGRSPYTVKRSALVHGMGHVSACWVRDVHSWQDRAECESGLADRVGPSVEKTLGGCCMFCCHNAWPTNTGNPAYGVWLRWQGRRTASSPSSTAAFDTAVAAAAAVRMVELRRPLPAILVDPAAASIVAHFGHICTSRRPPGFGFGRAAFSLAMPSSMNSSCMGSGSLLSVYCSQERL